MLEIKFFCFSIAEHQQFMVAAALFGCLLIAVGYLVDFIQGKNEEIASLKKQVKRWKEFSQEQTEFIAEMREEEGIR